METKHIIKLIKREIKKSPCLMADIWFQERIRINNSMKLFIEVSKIKKQNKHVLLTLGNSDHVISIETRIFKQNFLKSTETLPF